MENVIERLKALSIAEKIIIAAGAVLFIDGFLPWYSVSVGPVTVTRSGWQSPGALWSVLAVLTGLSLAGAVVLKNFSDVAIPDNVGGFSWPKIYLGAGVVALGFVVIKFLNEASYMGFGFYLGLIAAAALALGGFLAYKDEAAGHPPVTS